MSNTNHNKIGLLPALVPLIFLVTLMVINVIYFKDSSSSGPNQVALILSATLAALIGVFHFKIPYERIEKGIAKSIDMAMVACIILLIIGSVIGIWILSGIVPTLIYYGFKIIHPAIFLPIACIACCVVAIATGSSWTTTGTIGIALLAIGKTYGIPEGMVAGAIISGAYFGDKMSPLSDTTNLAPAMAGTDLFTHIRHMTYSTWPAIILAIVGYFILGLFYSGSGDNVEQIQAVASTIEKNFNIGIHLLIVPAIVLVLVAKKVPAIPALLAAIVLGIIAAVFFQKDLIANLNGGTLDFKAYYSQIMNVLGTGFKIETGNATIDSLFSRGGMSGMLSTIWLILSAMIFGGVLEATNILERLAGSILSMVKTSGSLVGATMASCIFTNITACDQYIAIVLPGRMFRKAYEKFKLHPKNLSRALEDSATVTSVLVPWNSCGAYDAGVLGVATLTYAPFCFFNILSPLCGLFLASMNWTIDRIAEENGQTDLVVQPT